MGQGTVLELYGDVQFGDLIQTGEIQALQDFLEDAAVDAELFKLLDDLVELGVGDRDD